MIAIDLLCKIFQQNGYDISDFTLNDLRGIFAFNEKLSQYYLVLDKNNFTDEDLIYIRSHGIAELSKKVKLLDAYQPGVDKNTILIICVNEKLTVTEEIPRIEEDAFTFKKNVLKYTKAAVNELADSLRDDFSHTNLTNLLFNPERFERMKNVRDLDYYKLLVDVFIKLPMLTLDGNKIQKIQSIQEKIATKLSKAALGEFLGAALNINWESVDRFEDIADICLLLEEA